MTILALAYNALMAVVDAAALIHLRRRRTASAWFSACGGTAAAAAGLAFVLAMGVTRSRFAVFGLAACGLFCHGTILLAGSAWLLRRTAPKTAVGSALLAAALVAVAVDAFWIEPIWLEVSQIRLESSKLQRPLRVVVLADLQTDVFGSYQQAVFRRALAAKPDLILLAGDYLQASRPARQPLRRRLNAFLKEIDFSAPAGVFAVRGNVDSDQWERIFDGLPVTTVESTRSFDVAGVRLTCLSLADSFNTGLRISSDESPKFHVVLGHAPDYALGRIEADLLVAGHTHGGQVRLPWIGPLLTLSAVPRDWAAGMTDLPNGAKLLVSRGIGMERGSAPPVRFFCRPELVVVDLTPR